MSTDPKAAETKPAVLPRRKPKDDEDGEKPLVLPRPGLLPTGLSRAIVLGAVVLSATLLAATVLPHRYALAPAVRSENALVYRIDTLTGRMSLCSASQCQPVAEK